jgi:hypothetical protein
MGSVLIFIGLAALWLLGARVLIKALLTDTIQSWSRTLLRETVHRRDDPIFYWALVTAMTAMMILLTWTLIRQIRGY